MKEYKLSKLVIIVVTLLFLTSVHCVVLAIGGRLIGFLNLTIGRAHVCTPVTFRNLVCRLLLEKKNVHKPGRRLLVAASDGRGFVVEEDGVLAQTRAGKQVLNVSGKVDAAVCVPVDGDSVAVIGRI